MLESNLALDRKSVKAGHGLILPPREDPTRGIADTIVQSTCKRPADLIFAMRRFASEAARWTRKLRAVFLDLELPRDVPEPSSRLLARSALSPVSVSTCSRSDAEFHIMLSELHYPPLRRRLR